MREIRLYGSEGGGAARSPYPYQSSADLDSRFRGNDVPFGFSLQRNATLGGTRLLATY